MNVQLAADRDPRPSPVRIRPATERELPALQAIERAAGEPFRSLGMDAIADDEPPTLEELVGYQRAGRALVVCVGDDDVPVGYLLWEPVDGLAHIEQVSVRPDVSRRGLGRALIERVARDSGLPGLTLTTFRDVPWNAPYYARLGFRVLAADEVTPGLRAVREHEAAIGLDRWPRVCMRR
ncbi:GNAT family N-acetyltransferase [Streptomyces sp. NPDC003077]|uniref:GNAT family N-acetyltransferase n=1 Tax=Streptomyces sp. NPDC003077 TaxID=3154443 RepID=UPI0033AAB614